MANVFKFIMDVIVSIIFSYPGAFIIWLFTGRKKPYKTILNDGNDMFNAFVGLLFFSVIIIIVAGVIHPHLLKINK